MKKYRVGAVEISASALSQQFARQIAYGYRKNAKFFKFAPKKIKVILCHSKEEWRKQSKYYYFAIAAGVVLRDGTVVLKDHTLLKRTAAQYRKLITHELNHAFWVKLVSSRNRLWQPLWLCEAVACRVAEDYFLLSKRDTLSAIRRLKWGPEILIYRYQKSLITSRKRIVALYSVWYHFLTHLNHRNPQRLPKFIKALRNMRTKSEYERLFERYFGDIARCYSEFVI